MAVVVFDADVLIGFLNRDDAHHAEAVDRIGKALGSGTRRAISAVTYSEILIGPMRTSSLTGADAVDGTLKGLRIEVSPVTEPIARVAGWIRAGTNLRLPDAYVVATALAERTREPSGVRVDCFDKHVVAAFKRTS